MWHTLSTTARYLEVRSGSSLTRQDEKIVILIDDRPTRGRRGMDWYHMASDDLSDGGLKELHTMARRLGLRPQWLHHHPGLPHFDVPDDVKRQAIVLGASEVTTRELVRRCKRAHEAASGTNRDNHKDTKSTEMLKDP